MISSKIIRFLCVAAFLVGFSTLAHAQATRTWVSGVGDDVNPCSRTAPCKTFAGAISKTAQGGEINVLDPGGFGALTITKAISVISQFEAGVLVSFGSSGMIVNTPANAEVLLQGLDFEGLGGSTQTPGAHGVRIISASKVTIQDCSIRNFAQNGISLAGPAGARALVQDTIILSNNNGINVAGISGANNVALLVRTTIDNHPGISVNVAAGSALFSSASTMTGSLTSVALGAGATFTSFGNNALQGTGTPTTTIALR